MAQPTGEPTVNEVKENIRAWMRSYLERTGWEQVRLATELGVSEPTISNILGGTVKPGFKILVRLHFRLGAPLYEVLRFQQGALAARK